PGWHGLATFGRGSTATRTVSLLAPKRFGAGTRCPERLAGAMRGFGCVAEPFRSGLQGRSPGVPAAGRWSPAPPKARRGDDHPGAPQRRRRPQDRPQTTAPRRSSTIRMPQVLRFYNAPTADWGQWLGASLSGTEF